MRHICKSARSLLRFCACDRREEKKPEFMFTLANAYVSGPIFCVQ